MTEKPKGKLQDKIDIAIDSIVQLSLGEKLSWQSFSALFALCCAAKHSGQVMPRG
jgi:hypothetical protein